MKYFVCSDPHGFTTIMKNDLHNAGFEEGNPGHKLIICGDCWDRGKEPVEMYRYLKDLGDQFLFVKGNHEDLLFDAYYEFKEYGMVISSHHIHNGTDRTVYALNKENILEEVLDWVDNKAIDFFETDHFIFVHGWIPCQEFDKWGYVMRNVYLENWRDSEQDWHSARWLNGMRQWHMGIKEPGKTIVCGHWHCGWGNMLYHEDRIPDMDLDDQEYYLSDHPFIDEGIIALDSCTALTKKINVVVLED